MALYPKEQDGQILVERDDQDAVLTVISATSSITIEELLHQLPWMRWVYLFSILGDCVQKGLVILNQKEKGLFEFRAVPGCHRNTDNVAEPVMVKEIGPSNGKNHKITI